MTFYLNDSEQTTTYSEILANAFADYNYCDGVCYVSFDEITAETNR